MAPTTARTDDATRDPRTLVGRAAALRFTLPTQLTRARQHRGARALAAGGTIGRLASAAGRFAAGVARPTPVRRLLAAPGELRVRSAPAMTRPPRWWTPELVDSSADMPSVPASLPARGLPRVAGPPATETSRTPGRFAAALESRAVRVKRLKEVAEIGRLAEPRTSKLVTPARRTAAPSGRSPSQGAPPGPESGDGVVRRSLTGPVPRTVRTTRPPARTTLLRRAWAGDGSPSTPDRSGRGLGPDAPVAAPGAAQGPVVETRPTAPGGSAPGRDYAGQQAQAPVPTDGATPGAIAAPVHPGIARSAPASPGSATRSAPGAVGGRLIPIRRRLAVGGRGILPRAAGALPGPGNILPTMPRGGGELRVRRLLADPRPPTGVSFSGPTVPAGRTAAASTVIAPTAGARQETQSVAERVSPTRDHGDRTEPAARLGPSEAPGRGLGSSPAPALPIRRQVAPSAVTAARPGGSGTDSVGGTARPGGGVGQAPSIPAKAGRAGSRGAPSATELLPTAGDFAPSRPDPRAPSQPSRLIRRSAGPAATAGPVRGPVLLRSMTGHLSMEQPSVNPASRRLMAAAPIGGATRIVAVPALVPAAVAATGSGADAVTGSARARNTAPAGSPVVAARATGVDRRPRPSSGTGQSAAATSRPAMAHAAPGAVVRRSVAVPTANTGMPASPAPRVVAARSVPTVVRRRLATPDGVRPTDGAAPAAGGLPSPRHWHPGVLGDLAAAGTGQSTSGSGAAARVTARASSRVATVAPSLIAAGGPRLAVLPAPTPRRLAPTTWRGGAEPSGAESGRGPVELPVLRRQLATSPGVPAPSAPPRPRTDAHPASAQHPAPGPRAQSPDMRSIAGRGGSAVLPVTIGLMRSERVAPPRGVLAPAASTEIPPTASGAAPPPPPVPATVNDPVIHRSLAGSGSSGITLGGHRDQSANTWTRADPGSTGAEPRAGWQRAALAEQPGTRGPTPSTGSDTSPSIAAALTSREWAQLVTEITRRIEDRVMGEMARRGRRSGMRPL